MKLLYYMHTPEKIILVSEPARLVGVYMKKLSSCLPRSRYSFPGGISLTGLVHLSMFTEWKIKNKMVMRRDLA